MVENHDNKDMKKCQQKHGFSLYCIRNICTILSFQSPTFYISISSPVDLFIIIPSHVPETVDTIPLPIRGPCKVVTSHIGIVIVIAFPLRSFALPLAFRVCLLSGANMADGFRTLAGCWWLKVFIGYGSWDSGCSSKIWSLLNIGGTFEGVTNALIVFEFFGTVGKGILAER